MNSGSTSARYDESERAANVAAKMRAIIAEARARIGEEGGEAVSNTQADCRCGNVTQERLDAAISAERRRCESIVQAARMKGNVDLRSIIHQIRSGELPEEE